MPAEGGLKLFVDAFVPALQHGEARFLGITDRERFEELRRMHPAHFFTHLTAAKRALRQGRRIGRSAQLKRTLADAAIPLRYFVFIQRHGKR